MFKAGDIIGLGARWWYEKWLPPLTKPRTNAVHHKMVIMCMPEINDYAICESKMGFGVRIGRLSWYLGYFIRVMRVPDESAAKMAVYEATAYGRHRYGYLTLPRMFLKAFQCWLTNGIKPVPYDYLPDKQSRGIVCTELVTKSYEKYYRIVPEGVASLPSAIEQARLDGKLITIFEGVLTHEVLGGM